MWRAATRLTQYSKPQTVGREGKANRSRQAGRDGEGEGKERE